jgi:hypothetical protein
MDLVILLLFSFKEVVEFGLLGDNNLFSIYDSNVVIFISSFLFEISIWFVCVPATE